MVRYANCTISSNMEQRPSEFAESPTAIRSDSDGFNRILGDLMDRLVTRAVLGSPQDMFAIEEVKLTDFRNLYGLVQCTPDLSQHFCNVSLRNALDAIPTCCGGRDGGRVLAPSCTIRYESGPFFETNGTTVTLFLLRIHLRSHRPTQPSLLDGAGWDKAIPETALNQSWVFLKILKPVQTCIGKRSNISRIVLITTEVPTVIVLLIILIWFFVRRARKEKVENDEIISVESSQFNFSTITVATNNFSNGNKLGREGFGDVYKGVLSNGQDIAVKRLSKKTDQGKGFLCNVDKFRSTLELVGKAILSACHIQNRIPYKKKCIYSKYEDNTCVVICLYVDDMLIFGTNLEVVCDTKKFLEHYVENILRKFERFDCKLVSTPYDPSSQLKKNREHSVAQIEYAPIIGSLMYLMNCTRPDIAYAAVSWKSAKQTYITRSTMEAEFIALEKASSEAECLRNLLADIPLWTRPAPSVSMRCDSQAAIAKTKSKIFNGKNRHIRLRHNIMRQLLETGIISLEFVRSELNLVDPLTKPLNKKLMEETLRGMGLMPITEVIHLIQSGLLIKNIYKTYDLILA
ncbi:Cysteine-rich receptor-like protein kinase 25 [Vitis vinifera]|uniref:Cysteine-rich receptor-like protein kinase 25 n=1 Tax=Vitis vinifera TaxID=29760 RepID=A0A438J6Z5_VITVI|nr:Cysteine-rich receptor-like protein kinase 25 [Vitis vinifera]